MASTKEYLEFITDQLSLLDEISFKKMMGEYILYYKGRVFGGIYDNRFLVKITPKALDIVENPIKELPYKGAKEMLLVDNLEDKEFLKNLIESIYEEFPSKNKKR